MNMPPTCQRTVVNMSKNTASHQHIINVSSTPSCGYVRAHCHKHSATILCQRALPSPSKRSFYDTVERARKLLALVSGPVFLAPSFGSPSQVARALCTPAQLLSEVAYALYAPTQPLLSNLAELALIPNPDSTIALRCDRVRLTVP